MTVRQDVLLMQASGRIADRLIVAAMGMFEMQLDALRVVRGLRHLGVPG